MAHVLTRSQHIVVLTTTSTTHTKPTAAYVVPTTTVVVRALLAGVAAVPVRWKAPAQGRIKCNIDAAFPDLSNRTGISICLRDEGGVCLFWPKQSALLVFTWLILAKPWVFITPCNE